MDYDKQFQIHIEYVNVLGQTVNFSSDLMTLEDCLQVKEEHPQGVVTMYNKGRFKRVKSV